MVLHQSFARDSCKTPFAGQQQPLLRGPFLWRRLILQKLFVVPPHETLPEIVNYIYLPRLLFLRGRLSILYCGYVSHGRRRGAAGVVKLFSTMVFSISVVHLLLTHRTAAAATVLLLVLVVLTMMAPVCLLVLRKMSITSSTIVVLTVFLVRSPQPPLR